MSQRLQMFTTDWCVIPMASAIARRGTPCARARRTASSLRAIHSRNLSVAAAASFSGSDCCKSRHRCAVRSDQCTSVSVADHLILGEELGRLFGGAVPAQVGLVVGSASTLPINRKGEDACGFRGVFHVHCLLNRQTLVKYLDKNLRNRRSQA